jgi:hypothetical protein
MTQDHMIRHEVSKDHRDHECMSQYHIDHQIITEIKRYIYIRVQQQCILTIIEK